MGWKMIDTLMVLWSRGIFTRFMAIFCSFLFFIAGTCLALFLIINSGIKWPGLAFTGIPANAPNPLASRSLPAAPQAATDITIPEILHNPTPAATPAPAASDQAQISEVTRSMHTELAHAAQNQAPTPPPWPPTPTAAFPQAPLEQPTIGKESPWFSNAISADSKMTGSFASEDSQMALNQLFWSGFAASTLMALCGLGLLLSLNQKRGRSKR